MRMPIAVGACAVLVGCANLNTVYREVSGSPVDGRSFVVDAAQRSVIAVQKKTGTGNDAQMQTVVCPEPYPDAVAAFFSSGSATAALTASDAASKQIQAAFASGSAVASFGTRTNSTVLLTNQLSANCFAFMNGATQDSSFMELQRRGQTFNLGVLAIERLTGTDRGEQAGAAGRSSAQTGGGADVNALQGTAAKAAEAATAAQVAVDKADDELLAKTQQVNAQAAVRKAATDAQANVPSTDTAGLAAAAADVDKQNKALTDLQAQAAQLRLTAEAAAVTLTQAKTDLRGANSRLQTAQNNAAANGAGTTSTTVNTQPGSSKDVADAVVRIVNLVLLEAGRGEGCNAILLDFPKQPNVYASGAGLELLKACVANREQNSEALRAPLRQAR